MRPQRALLAEAFFWLVVSRMAILILPFRWTTRLLTLQPGEGTAAHSPSVKADSRVFARRARRALVLVGRRNFWNPCCLTKALAGVCMLRLRRIPTVLSVGVNNPANPDRLKSHAWLSSGGIVVTGAPGHKTYHPIATFAYRPDPSLYVSIFGFLSKH